MFCYKCYSDPCKCAKPISSIIGGGPTIPRWDPINTRQISPTPADIANPLSQLDIMNPLNPLSPFGPGKPPVR